MFFVFIGKSIFLNIFLGDIRARRSSASCRYWAYQPNARHEIGSHVTVPGVWYTIAHYQMV